MRCRWIGGIALACIALATPRAGAQPHVGEVKLLPYGYCPNGWMEADGRLLPISENEALFQLYGTTYGGDGQETFALPDLRGRIPLGVGVSSGGSSRVLGESGGAEQVTLLESQLPAHTHSAGASSSLANVLSPQGALWAAKIRTPLYRRGATADVARAPDSVGVTGATQPHENQAPYTTLRFCVSLFGVYPSPN